MNDTILEIRNLSVGFTQYDRGFARRTVSGVKQMNLSVSRGEIVAVVGASGSGKSLLAHAIMGILPYNSFMSGEIFYEGRLLDEKRQRQLRGHEIVLVPQSVSYLDPLMKIRDQLENGRKDQSIREKCRSLLSRYGLPAETEKKYPFELSGGMTRRVLIATAMVEEPKFVIADEPTPGLHLEAAIRVMGHFREMAEGGAGVLLITHDLELAIRSADRIAVLYGGQVIEVAEAKAFEREENLTHPFTRALVKSMPKNWNPDGDGLCDTKDILDYMRKEYGR